jgi:hypothetical protein
VPQTKRPTKCSLFKCQYDNSKLVPGVWYNAHVRRDHTQIIGLRLNLLEPSASSGVYDDIANAIDAIKSPFASAQAEAFEFDLENSNTVHPAAIAVPVSVGALLLAALAAVTIRRRRNRVTKDEGRMSVYSSNGSINAEDAAKRASIVAFASTSSVNPTFDMHPDGDVSIKV